MGSHFLHGNREVVTNGAFGEEERVRDLGNAGSTGSCSQYLALPLGKRIIALAECRHRERGIDDPLTGNGPPDGRRKLGRWSILEEETDDATLHGLAQVAWTSEGRQDEYTARRQPRVERGCGGDAIASWHLDIQ